MLPRKMSFVENAKVKIVQVNSVDYDDGLIKAVVTTSQFDRVTTRPYIFTLIEWAEVVERGWIE